MPREQKHTETPWRRVDAEDWHVSGPGSFDVIAIGRDNRKVVALIVGPVADEDEVDANASVVMKAVNSYDSLKQQRDELVRVLQPFADLARTGFVGSVWENAPDDVPVHTNHATGKSVTIGDFKAAVAALTRATGEQS